MPVPEPSRSVSPAPFLRFGPEHPASPVILSVPHAGREYPPVLADMARVPVERLEGLEDRHADLLIEKAVAGGATAFVARHPRCWIDLNRDEREIDPAMITPAPRRQDIISSAKVRGGLGLLPRRFAGIADIWKQPLPADELAARIRQDHRPWHAALAGALADARDSFGAALLLDCHSMPPLPPRSADGAAHIVLGDRYGHSASSLLMDRLVSLVEGAGLRCARNAPYAGGYTLSRQAVPARSIHAIQVEIDRSLYLAPGLREPGMGLPRIQSLVAAMVTAMEEELTIPFSRAAE